MTLLYWMVLFSGLGITLVLLIRRQRISHQKNIIEKISNEPRNKVLARIDYVNMIVKNSRWLTFLDNLEKQIAIKLRIFIVMASILFVANHVGLISVSIQGLAMNLLLIFIAIVVMPALILKPAINSRVKIMMDSLPYFIDLIAVCVQSGMTVESALKYIAERFDNLDVNLSCLIDKVIIRAEVSGLEEALHELYRSMNITEMRMFCSTLQQSVHYGTSLYENLMELSKDIRELQLLDTEEKVGKLSAQMSIPLILFIMFPITILIAAPGILRIMQNGLF